MSSAELAAALRTASSERAQAPALTFLDHSLAERTLTYGELFDLTGQLASRLRELLPAPPHPVVGILAERQETQALHYLAALEANMIPAVLTPPNPKLNRDYYARTMQALLTPDRFDLLITDLEPVPSTLPALWPFDLQWRNGDEIGVERRARVPDDTALLQFSSGTTGIKRGVPIREPAVRSQLNCYGQAIRLEADDCIVSWLPLYHDMGFIACLHLPLWFGAHSVMLEPMDWVRNPASLLQAVSRFRGSISWNPNFAFAFMARRIRDRQISGVDLSSLRMLINCSEPVTYASQVEFRERFGPYGLPERVFTGCYAMAETTFALTHGPADTAEALDYEGPSNVATNSGTMPFVSVGTPLPSVELDAVDGDGQSCPDGVIGELWVRSPFTFDGYFNDNEATAAVLVEDGWFRTGDLGYRRGHRWYVTGRVKDVLIVGGVNVFPQDLETVAGEVDGVLDGRVAAFAEFDAELQTERVTILAESSRRGDRGEEIVLDIRQRILATFQLANFDVRLVEPGWLVKSTSGKVARAENRAKWERQRLAAD